MAGGGIVFGAMRGTVTGIEKALKAHVWGTVTLSLAAGIDGKPRDVRVEKKLAYGLDENSIEAVRQWKFEPQPAMVGPLRRRFTWKRPSVWINDMHAPHRFSKSTGSRTSVTLKCLARAGYFFATASNISYATVR